MGIRIQPREIEVPEDDPLKNDLLGRKEPAETQHAKSQPRQSLGRWLVENTPRGIELEIPDRHEPERPIPFIDEEDE
jgi:hypothetical protein